MESPRSLAIDREAFSSYCSGKWVLFTCVGTDITKYEVYQHIRSLGVNLSIIDNPSSVLGQRLQADGVAHFIPLDMTSRPTLVDEAKEVVDNFLREKGVPLSGITTFWDDAVCLNSRLCQLYGLPGNSPRSTDIAHDKAASRQFLAQLGYSGPKSLVVGSEADVVQAASQLTFPAILKPLYGAASIGVMKVENAEEAVHHYRTVQKTLDTIYAEGELMGLTFDDADAEVGNDSGALRRVVFEEFIVGPEFDCDVILLDGEVVYVNLMDDWEFEKPHFIELGSSCPSTRPREVQDEVRAFGQRVLRDMGFHTGVFHVEIIYSERLGPCLVEVNPRMGGGPVRSIHRSVYGVDLADYVICAALGLAMMPVIKKSEKSAVTINLFAKKSGVLTRSIEDCMSALNGRDDVVSKLPVGEVGTELTGWFDGYPSALGRVNFMIDDDIQGAISLGKRLVDDFYREVDRHTEVRELSQTH